MFAGGVGTGFDQALLEALTERLGDLETNECPFDPATAGRLSTHRTMGGTTH